jgi:nudix-type nucleoside diphosphatase (YffH/AdpP family)
MTGTMPCGGEMNVTAPEITAVTTLHDGWIKLLKLAIKLPDGEVVGREVEDHGAVAAVLPFDPDRRTAILVRQFRAPVVYSGGPPRLLEVIAGILDEDDAEDCARREAYEEVGLRLGGVERVGTVWSSPGISTERMHLFIAAYRPADRIAEGGGRADEHEDIDVVEISLRELWGMIERGEILDLKTLALAQALKLRRPDIFAE